MRPDEHISREGYVISDLHLLSLNAQPGLVRKFLQSIPSDAPLIINGDLFNEGAEEMLLYGKYPDIVYLLIERPNTVFVRGNHDMDPAVFKSLFGRQLLKKIELRLDKKRYIVRHGHEFDALAFDTLARESRFYILKKLITFSWVKLYFFFVRHIPFHRHALRYLRRWLERIYHRIAPLSAKAVVYAKNHGYDGIIVGHEHKASLAVIDDIEYYNSGSWVRNRPCTYLHFTKDGISVHTFQEA